MFKFVFKIEELLVFGVEQVLILESEETQLLTACAHFYLTKLNQRATQLFQTLVQVFVRDHVSLSTGQGLHWKAAVFELSKHLLDRPNLVDDIKMILLVDMLLKCACKLLDWIDEHLQPLAIDFERFGK